MLQETLWVPMVWIVAFAAIEILAYPGGPREFTARVSWDMCVAAMGIYVSLASRSTPPATASDAAIIAGLIVTLGVLLILIRRRASHTWLQALVALALGMAAVVLAVLATLESARLSTFVLLGWSLVAGGVAAAGTTLALTLVSARSEIGVEPRPARNWRRILAQVLNSTDPASSEPAKSGRAQVNPAKSLVPDRRRDPDLDTAHTATTARDEAQAAQRKAQQAATKAQDAARAADAALHAAESAIASAQTAFSQALLKARAPARKPLGRPDTQSEEAAREDPEMPEHS